MATSRFACARRKGLHVSNELPPRVLERGRSILEIFEEAQRTGVGERFKRSGIHIKYLTPPVARSKKTPEERKEYKRAWNKRPEVKARSRDRRRQPGAKAKLRTAQRQWRAARRARLLAEYEARKAAA